MASVEKDGQGYRVRFIDHNRQRRAIRLGGLNKQNAEKIARHIEELVVWKKSGLTLDSATATWIGKIGDDLHGKLAAAGLIPKRVSATLGQFLEQHIDAMAVKPGTKQNMDLVRWNLIACFGEQMSMRAFAAGHGHQFRNHLLIDEKLAENTVRRRCGRARQFLTAAIRAGVAMANPFDEVPVTVQGNKSKSYFLKTEDAEKILEACIDSEWRLIFALCRWGGLRCPSEVLSLRWEDILWDRQRIVVKSPKTERIKGKESRVIPMFPELERELSTVFAMAEEGCEFCITRYRWKNQNLRTQFGRIIKAAGLQPWPKLFHNLRATRETELADILPAHVVCSWIGNSQIVAMEHYLHANDAHFEKMTGGGAQLGAASERMPKHANAPESEKR